MTAKTLESVFAAHTAAEEAFGIRGAALTAYCREKRDIFDERDPVFVELYRLHDEADAALDLSREEVKSFMDGMAHADHNLGVA